MSDIWGGPLEKIDDYRWRIPKSYKPGMRVDGIIYADERLLRDIRQDKAPEQVANVAFLPQIVKASLAMPDIHWGYGPSIGAVFATDIDSGGVITPAGVGFDINCGVRLLKTNFQYEEIKHKIKDLIYVLFDMVPAGVGSKGDIRISEREEREILIKGARWAVEKGYGIEEDLECTEEYGAMEGADPSTVSQRAYERGKAQSGTLGSGNHFLEIQMIDQLYDRNLCSQFGLTLGQIMVMIHSGSRGFGYQICDDYTRSMIQCLSKYNIKVPDRQLACAPFNSPEGKAYFSAMKCAANYAWNNRQCLMYLVRKGFEKVFGMGWQKMGMYLIYDVAHNIAKVEKHTVDGKKLTLCVHRKGATRAFGPNSPELPNRYKNTAQPVIIPGDMGRNSYLLVGTQKAMEETFGSTCHGAGRVKSRTTAMKSIDVNQLLRELDSKGIIVKASGKGTIVEEAPQAYKDVNEVVDVVHKAGISNRVCRMKPLGVIKG
ncbi:MAG: RtcB family protein [Candidatus Omnitrophica bacterium]|nr:RtcB family protein [Candidatus Omnitrophota bacterium]